MLQRNQRRYHVKKEVEKKFKWVKAHAGIFGKEIADRLAKEATQNYYVTYSRIPKNAIKKDTRKISIKNGNVNGRKQRKGRLLKNFFQV
jgi:ribonuclease HI